MFNWLKDGLTYKPVDMNAGTSRLADYRLSDENSASNNFCLTLTVRYVITILPDLVRGEPIYTSSSQRVESTLSGSDSNIASNSLTSSSNVGLCIGDSCQHFNIIWYLRKQEKPKTRTICFSILPDVFFSGSSICHLHISKNVPCLPQKFAKALLSISLGTVRGSLLPFGTLSYMFLTHESEAVGAGTMWLLTSFYIFIHFNLTVPVFFVGCLTLASGGTPFCIHHDNWSFFGYLHVIWTVEWLFHSVSRV